MCFLPSCWTMRKVGDRGFSPRLASLCLPLLSSFCSARLELLASSAITCESLQEGLF